MDFSLGMDGGYCSGGGGGGWRRRMGFRDEERRKRFTFFNKLSLSLVLRGVCSLDTE